MSAESQLRLIRYNEENNELLTGDQDGRIIVWNLKMGKTIYTWKAHVGAITQMIYDAAHKILITGGKDKKVIFGNYLKNGLMKMLKSLKKMKLKILMILWLC